MIAMECDESPMNLHGLSRPHLAFIAVAPQDHLRRGADCLLITSDEP